jgi:Skp family chaperone for outer membrane proteins
MNWKPWIPWFGLLMLGCQQPQTSSAPPKPSNALIAATIDTLPILQQDPAYQELAKKYTVQNIELSKRIKGELDQGKLSKDEAGAKFLKEQEKLNKVWMKNTNDFIQTRHTKMRAAVKEMCEEKEIDMVLIHSKVYPTVVYGAFDITQDVLMKIYGPKGGTPTPGGTPQ